MDNFKYTLMKDEGFRAKVYLDHLGFPTIGYGTKISELDITKEEAERWLDAELDEKEVRLRQIPEYDGLSIVRKNVIRSMAYQMGVAGTKKFKNMWRAIARGDFVEAGAQMRDSQWFRDPQTRTRADRMSRRMMADVWRLS
jgi:lysozyme